MPIDNSTLIAPFCPAIDDGDTFIYTEMLDRSKTKGNNGFRLVKTFYHRSVEEFWSQVPTIKTLCDMSGCRAYTRLAQRSFKKVGKRHAQLVMDAVLSENWAGMKSLYNKACGTVSPDEKLWLLDVDEITSKTEYLAEVITWAGLLRARIPSRKGVHLICTPFDPRQLINDSHGWSGWGNVSLQKDNPTNLYIPDNAA